MNEQLKISVKSTLIGLSLFFSLTALDMFVFPIHLLIRGIVAAVVILLLQKYWQRNKEVKK